MKKADGFSSLYRNTNTKTHSIFLNIEVIKSKVCQLSRQRRFGLFCGFKYPQNKILIPGIKFVGQAYCSRNVSSYTQHIFKANEYNFQSYIMNKNVCYKLKYYTWSVEGCRLANKKLDIRAFILKLNHFVREHSFFVTIIYFRLCRLYVTPFKLCEARFCKDRRAYAFMFLAW